MTLPFVENAGVFRKVLDAVETLRPFDESGKLECKLPEIVVVGDQSSGKTSIVESLLGFELPTGNQIATRLPLRVQLRNEPDFNAQLSWTDSNGEICTVANVKKSEVASKIEQATEEIAGDHYKIEDVPLHLSVKGPNYSNFTLTDLPGITRVPVGEQPSDIEVQIKGLIEKYIRGSSKIILCTCPSNVDLSTNASLALAALVDQSKSRTLGLITKADCATQATVDQMQDPKNLGLHLNVPLGFIALRCRSEDEKNNGFTLQDAKDCEEGFFNSDSSPFKGVDRSYLGLTSLVARLEQLMKAQVKLQLPQICAQVDKLIKSQEDTLFKLTGPAKNEAEATNAIESFSYKIMRQFEERVTCRILDDLTPISANVHKENRAFAAKVDELTSNILTDSFLMEVEKTSQKVIGSGFIEDQYHLMFEESSRRWIVESLIGPSLQLIDSVCRQTEFFLYELIRIEVGHFPQLFDAYARRVEDFLQKQKMHATVYVENVIRCHSELFSLESTVGSDLYTQGQNEWAIIAGIYRKRICSPAQPSQKRQTLKEMVVGEGHYVKVADVEESTEQSKELPLSFVSTVVQSESDLDWLQKRLEIPGTMDLVATQFRVANYSRQVRLVVRELVPRLVKLNILTKVYKDDALLKSFSTYFREREEGLLSLFTQGPDSEEIMFECRENLSILKDVKSELLNV